MACSPRDMPGTVALVCVPYAGGRPGVLVPLARAFGDLNVLTVQLLGHGSRVRERPHPWRTSSRGSPQR